MAKHLNIDICSKCEELMSNCKNTDLLNFYRLFRNENKDAHVSCCLRGKEEQEKAFATGHSKAHFGQSAHNYALAIDWFRLTQAGGANFDASWYRDKLKPASDASGLIWGGDWSFKDLPHVEIKDWKKLI